MTISVERYVNPHSRENGGTQRISFETEKVEDIRPINCYWIEEPTLKIVLKNESFVISQESFFNLLKNGEEG